MINFLGVISQNIHSVMEIVFKTGKINIPVIVRLISK